MPIGWSQGYIRRASGADECITAGGGIIQATAGQLLSLRTDRTDNNGAGTQREPNASGIQIVQLDDDWDYLNLSRSADVAGPTGNEDAFVDVTYDTQTEVEGGSFAHTIDTGDITLKTPGHYLVMANTYLGKPDDNTRTAYQQRLTLDGGEIGGTRTTVYIRGNESTDEGATAIGTIIETTDIDQILSVEVAKETGTNSMIMGGKTGLTIVRLPDNDDAYIRLGDDTAQDFNDSPEFAAEPLGWNNQLETGGSFTHNTVTDNSQIGIVDDGDYLFFNNLYDNDDDSSSERQVYRQGWEVNEGGILNYGQTARYSRDDGNQNNGNWSGILLGLNAGDTVEAVSGQLGNGGVLSADINGLQGVALSSLFIPPVTLTWNGTDNAWASANWDDGPVSPAGKEIHIVGSGLVQVQSNPLTARALTIDGGEVEVQPTFTLDVSGAVKVNGGTLDVDGTLDAGSVTITFPGTIAIDGTIETGSFNNDAITTLAAGDLLQTGSATMAGVSFSAGGGAELGVGGAASLGPVTTNGGTNVISGAGAVTMSGLDDQAVAGGMLTRSGGGSLSVPGTLSAAAAAATTFRVERGSTLEASGNNPLGGSTRLELAGGTFRISGFQEAITSPTMTGLAFWLDADDPATLAVNTDGTGGTPAADGDVGYWIDKSGNGHDARADLGSPQYVLDGINGKPVLHFVASETDNLEFPDVTAQGSTVFMMYKMNAGSGWRQPLNADADWVHMTNGTERALQKGSGDQNLWSGESAHEWKIQALQLEQQDYRLWVDGVLTGPNTSSTQTFGAFVEMGHQTCCGFDYLDMDVAEVLVYDSPLTDDERARIGAYLEDKYGLDTDYALPMGAVVQTGLNVAVSADSTIEAISPSEASFGPLSFDGSGILELTGLADRFSFPTLDVNVGGTMGITSDGDAEITGIFDGNGNTFAFVKDGLGTLTIGDGVNLDGAIFDVQEGTLIGLQQATTPLGNAALELNAADTGDPELDPDGAVIVFGGTYGNAIEFAGAGGTVITGGDDAVQTNLTGLITPTAGVLKMRTTDARTMLATGGIASGGTGIVDIGAGVTVSMTGSGPYDFDGAVISGGALSVDHNVTARKLDVLAGDFLQTGADRDLTITESLTLRGDYDLSAATVNLTGADVTVAAGKLTVGNDLTPVSMDLVSNGELDLTGHKLTTGMLQTKAGKFDMGGSGTFEATGNITATPATGPSNVKLTGGSLQVGGVVAALPGLMGYWPFDSDSTDASGNGYDGEFVGDSRLSNDVPAMVGGGQSLDLTSLDGADPYSNVVTVDTGPGQTVFDLDSITISVWVKGFSQRNWAQYVSKGDGGGGYMLRSMPADGANPDGITAWWLDNGAGDNNPGTIAMPANPDEWYHLLATYDSVTGDRKMWIDGELSIDTNEGAGTAARPIDKLLVFGGRHGGDIGWSSNVMLDEIYIFDRAVSEAEAQQLRQFGMGTGSADFSGSDVEMSVPTALNTSEDVTLGTMTVANSPAADYTLDFGGEGSLTFAGTTFNEAMTGNCLIVNNTSTVNLGPLDLGGTVDPCIEKNLSGALIVADAVGGYTGTATYNANEGSLVLGDPGLLGGPVNMADGAVLKLSSSAGDKVYNETVNFTGASTLLAGKALATSAETATVTFANDLALAGQALTLGTTEETYTLKAAGTVTADTLAPQGPGGVVLDNTATIGTIAVPEGSLTLAGGGSADSVGVTGGMLDIQNVPFVTPSLSVTDAGAMTSNVAQSFPEMLVDTSGTVNVPAGVTVSTKLTLGKTEITDDAPVVIVGTDLGTATGTLTASGGAFTIAGPPLPLSYIPITSDEDSQISTDKIYTHKNDFGNADGTTVNGVVFDRNISNGSTSIPNEHAGDYNFDIPDTEAVRELFKDMRYNDSTSEIVLTDLTPGQWYDFRLYNRSWGNGGSRTQDFLYDVGNDGSTEDTVTLNTDDPLAVPPGLDAWNRAYAMSYTYQAAANGELKININSAIAGNTIHNYGLTNEETTAPAAGGGVIDMPNLDVVVTQTTDVSILSSSATLGSMTLAATGPTTITGAGALDLRGTLSTAGAGGNLTTNFTVTDGSLTMGAGSTLNAVGVTVTANSFANNGGTVAFDGASSLMLTPSTLTQNGGSTTFAPTTVTSGITAIDVAAGTMITPENIAVTTLSVDKDATLNAASALAVSDSADLDTVRIATSGAAFTLRGSDLSNDSAARTVTFNGGLVSMSGGGAMPDGVKIWLDASTIVAGDGDAVAQWDDQSGLGNHAIQTITGDQPKYVAASGLNGQPAVQFDQDNDDNGDDMLFVGGNLASQVPDGASWFAVTTIRETVNKRYNIFGNTDSDSRLVAQNWNEFIPGEFRSQRVGTNSAYASTPDSGNHLWSQESDSTVYRVLLNGEEHANANNTGTYSGGNANWILGNRGLGNSQAFNGDIAEFMVFDRVLTVEEANNVGGYLTDKYGLDTTYTGRVGGPMALPNTDIYVTADTTLDLGSSMSVAFGNLDLGGGNTLTLASDDEAAVTVADLSGSGTINGDMAVHGMVDVGEVTVDDGGLTFGPDATYNAEVTMGDNSSTIDADTITVTGSSVINLDGTLAPKGVGRTKNDFFSVSNPADPLMVIDNSGELNGVVDGYKFAAVDPAPADDKSAHIGQGAFLRGVNYERPPAGVNVTTSVDLEVFVALGGDADGDKKVWLSDWAALRANFGNTGTDKTWTDGNFDPWVDG
ncbi:MAG: hypothetical protein HQ567_33315, partial [Candidatus Nealsonbacteria bacterium]|nr:hypothetical protein [Candidatus Nealsonbacteria bacterium]